MTWILPFTMLFVSLVTCGKIHIKRGLLYDSQYSQVWQDTHFGRSSADASTVMCDSGRRRWCSFRHSSCRALGKSKIGEKRRRKLQTRIKFCWRKLIPLTLPFSSLQMSVFSFLFISALKINFFIIFLSSSTLEIYFLFLLLFLRGRSEEEEEENSGENISLVSPKFVMATLIQRRGFPCNTFQTTNLAHGAKPVRIELIPKVNRWVIVFEQNLHFFVPTLAAATLASAFWQLCWQKLYQWRDPDGFIEHALKKLAALELSTSPECVANTTKGNFSAPSLFRWCANFTRETDCFTEVSTSP